MIQGNVYTRIKELEQGFIDWDQPIVEGYNFNQLETIKQIHRFYAGKYESGNEDEFGVKYFYNITKPLVLNAQKNLDLDTKDINVRARQGVNLKQKAFFYRRALIDWMKDEKIGKKINKMAKTVPRYGSLVAKRVGTDSIFELVNLKNLKNDPTAESLQNSWIIENHYYTPEELRAMKGIWDNDAIDEALKSWYTYGKENYVDGTQQTKLNNEKSPYIHVREYYDEVPESWLNDEEAKPDDNYVLAQFVVVLPEDAEGEKGMSNVKNMNGLCLFKQKIKIRPYKECHYDKEEGRWLGVGIVEDLFDAQMMENKAINLYMQALEISNLILFATNDGTVAQNVLTDLLNGDIVEVQGTLQRISTEIRSAGVDQIIMDKIERLSSNLANSPEVTTGSNLPSGTPFRLGMLLDQNANKLFDFIREDFGMFLQEIFEDWILPEFSKKLNSKDYLLEIAEQEEIDEIFEEMAKKEAFNGIKKAILSTGNIPNNQEISQGYELIKNRMAKPSVLRVEVPKDFFKGVEMKLDIMVTGERENKAERLTTLSTLLQNLGANPALIDNPLFTEILDIVGINPAMAKQKEPIASTQGQPAGNPAGNMEQIQTNNMQV